MKNAWPRRLGVVVIIVTALCIWGGCGSKTGSAEQQATAHPARPAGHPARPGPGALLLPSHASQAVTKPNAGDVDPSFHAGLEQLRRRVADDSTDAASLLKLARLLQDGHQTDEAVETYRRYLRLAPGSREAWLDLANTLGTLRRWPEALAASDSLLAHYPDDPSGLYNKGAVLANLGRTTEAKTIWTAVATQDVDPKMRQLAEAAISRLEK